MIAVSFSVPFENPGFQQKGPWDIWFLGIGSSIATGILSEYLSKKRPRFLVISGFAGALDPSIEAGETFLCENASDFSVIQTLLRKGWQAPPSAKLHTSEELVTTADQKSHLYRMTGMDLVDMETRSLFEVAHSYAVPTITIRAVSDTAQMDFPLPESILYDQDRQRPRPLALCAHLTRKPRCIPGFIGLLTHILKARIQLKRHLLATLRVMLEIPDENI